MLIFWYQKINFWYQKITFWYQKMCEFLISENHFLISENHFLISENRGIFWYQKIISDIRKSNFCYQKIIFWYQKIGIKVLFGVPYIRDHFEENVQFEYASIGVSGLSSADQYILPDMENKTYYRTITVLQSMQSRYYGPLYQHRYTWHTS